MKSKNHIKMQRFAIFVKKNLRINMLEIKNIITLGTNVSIQMNMHMQFKV